MKTRLLLKLILVIAATFSALCAFGVEKVVEFDFTTQYDVPTPPPYAPKVTYDIYGCNITEEVYDKISHTQNDVKFYHCSPSISHDQVTIKFNPDAKFCINRDEEKHFTAIPKLENSSETGGFVSIIFSCTDNSSTIKDVKIFIEQNEVNQRIFLFEDEASLEAFQGYIEIQDFSTQEKIGDVQASLNTITLEEGLRNLYMKVFNFSDLNIYKITVTIECEEGGEEEEDDEEEEIVVEEHDPLKGYEVGAEVNLGLLQVVKSGDKYIYATYGTEYYILTSTNAASYGANSKINAVGTKVIDETLQLPVVQLAENEALPTSTYVSIKDITAEMMFKYVEVEHVNIANGAISDDNGSIAINDIFSICPDSKPDCNVIGIVAKKPAVPSQASKKRATAESELAIIPTEVISNGTISSAPVAPKDSNIKVKGSTITVADCADYEIIDLNGRIIACNRPATNCSPGLYFVKTPSTTHKVLIK